MTTYYKITENWGNVTWYKVDHFDNHFDKPITRVIEELLSDMHDTIELESQDTPPTEEQLRRTKLAGYEDIKAFLAMHIIGLD